MCRTNLIVNGHLIRCKRPTARAGARYLHPGLGDVADAVRRHKRVSQSH
jgi:hypothetical protein